MYATKDGDTRSKRAFEFDRAFDPERYKSEFQECHRLRIPDLLKSSDALALYHHLSRDIEWRAFLAVNGRLLAAPSELHGVYTTEFDRMLLSRAYEGSRNGLAWLFEANRLFAEDIPGDTEDLGPPQTAFLDRFSEFLNSPLFLSAARLITGVQGIHHAAIQATRFRPGHFAGFIAAPCCDPRRGRPCAAFAFNLTLEWMVEWGGMLEFRANKGYVVEAYVPSFNVLDFYSLPQGHWIGAVTPVANGTRLTINGRLYAD
jgi:hypothetical protein